MSNEIFSNDLIENFASDNFYAKAKTTKLYLITNNAKELIGNAVVANIEEVNEKTPVWSYNSSQYAKFLQGKEIITGVLALRKITVSNFLSLISKAIKNSSLYEEKTSLEDMISNLRKITSRGINTDNLIKDLEMKLLKLKSMDDAEVISRYDSGINSNISKKNSLLYYMEVLKSVNAEAKLKIVFEGDMGEDESPMINIKDVLFTKKQTEISVDKTDIIEVYSFFGNPDY